MLETGSVPRRKIPMPQQASEMQRLTSDVASLILRELITVGAPVRRGDLNDRIPLHRETIRRGFDDLEALGAIVADLPPGARRGRVPLYHVDPIRLAAIQNAYTRWLNGEAGEELQR